MLSVKDGLSTALSLLHHHSLPEPLSVTARDYGLGQHITIHVNSERSVVSYARALGADTISVGPDTSHRIVTFETAHNGIPVEVMSVRSPAAMIALLDSLPPKYRVMNPRAVPVDVLEEAISGDAAA